MTDSSYHAIDSVQYLPFPVDAINIITKLQTENTWLQSKRSWVEIVLFLILGSVLLILAVWGVLSFYYQAQQFHIKMCDRLIDPVDWCET